MLSTSDLLDVKSLDLLTEDERNFNEQYVKMLRGYADGNVSGVQIRNLTSGASTIAKRQQSRSAVALLKWNMATRQIEEDARPALLEARK